MDLAAAVGTHLGQELGSEGAVLDLGQDLLHLLAGLGGDEALAGAVVAVLCGVGDGVAHLGEAALVDEVNDQLHLVAGLEVGHLRLVASLDQRVEACVDQLADAAAKHCLLAEQVGLGLLLEGGLEDACAAGTDAGSVCQSDVLCLTGEVLLDADQRGAALTLGVQAADDVAGAFRSDHDDIDVLRSGDGLEVDVEAVCEGQSLALGHVRSDLLVVDVSAQLIGNQHHDDVACLGCLLDLHDLEVLVCCCELRSLFPVSGTLAQTDDDVDAALGEVLGMSVALTAEADDSNGLAVQHAEVAVGIVVFLDRHDSVLLLMSLFQCRINVSIVYFSLTGERKSKFANGSPFGGAD